MQALEDYKGNDASIRHLQQTSYKLNEDLSRDHAGVSGFEQQLVAAVEPGKYGTFRPDQGRWKVLQRHQDPVGK